MTQLSWEAVAGHAYAAGLRGEVLAIATAITEPESTRDPTKVGDQSLAGRPTADGRTWGNSIGLWQVRSIREESGSGRSRDATRLTDPTFNARSMYEISAGGTNWRPWSTYVNGAYRQHLPEARAAAQAVEARGGTPGTTTTSATTTAAASDVGTVTPDVDAGGLAPISQLWTISPMITGFAIMGRPITETAFRHAITAATLDLSVDQIGEITITVVDPAATGFNVERELLLGTRVEWWDLHCEIAELERSDGDGVDTITVKVRSSGVGKLRTKPPTAASKTWVSRSATEVAYDVVRSAGLRFLGQGSARRSSIVRAGRADDPNTQTESDWDLLTRLAREEGYWCFESAGLVVFGRPSWLAGRAPRFPLHHRPGDAQLRNGILRLTSAKSSYDTLRETGQRTATIGCEIPAWLGQQVRPGMIAQVGNLGSFVGDYLVTRVSAPIGGDQPVGVDLATPVDPVPDGTGEATANTSGGEGTTSGGQITGAGGNVLDFVTICLAQAGDRYVYGAETRPDDPNPSVFDCSELVEWACARVGIRFVDGSSNQIAACRAANRMVPVAEARNIRGCLLWKQGHVAVSLGDGRTIEAMGSQYGVRIGEVGARFVSAGFIPGIDYRPVGGPGPNDPTNVR